MARSLPPWSSAKALPTVAPTVTVLARVSGAPARSRRRVEPATALTAAPVPRAAALRTTKVAPSLVTLTGPAKVLAPARTRTPLPEWVRPPPVRPLPEPVVAETTPAMVKVVPAAGAKEPPVSRSRAMPRLAESVRSAVVRRPPLAVKVKAAGVTAARATPSAVSSPIESRPALTEIGPLKAEPDARLVVPAPTKARLPEPTNGVAKVRTPPPLPKLLAPETVKSLSVDQVAPPRLRAKVPALRVMSPTGSAPAASRRSVPPFTRTPVVEAVVPAKARVPPLTMVAPA